MMLKSLILVIVTAALPAFGDVGPSTDQAVMDYLRLMSQGKKHAQAMAIVVKQYNLTDEQLNEAAERIARSGLQVNPDLVVLDRNPAKTEAGIK